MDSANQLARISMDWSEQLAWSAAAVGITLTASLILFGIWRRGYSGIEAAGETSRGLRDEGVKWMFLACMLWCFTVIVQTVSLLLTGNLSLDRLALTFIRVVFSLASSLCFVLASANLDAVMRASNVPAKFLQRIRYNNPYWLLTFLIIVAVILRFIDPAGKYLKSFDALVTSATIFLIAWVFFKSFWRRNFPLIAFLSVVVFLVFWVAQLWEFLDALTPNLPLARKQFLGMALSVGADGMVSLLFIALAFSSVHEKAERLAEMVFIESIPSPLLREVK